MKIIVEGHEIETREIVKIEEAGGRRHGFVIHLIGPKTIDLTIPEEYESYSYELANINDRYRKLRNEVIEYWEKDKTDIPVLNL